MSTFPFHFFSEKWVAIFVHISEKTLFLYFFVPSFSPTSRFLFLPRWAILVHKDAASKHSASESTAAAAAIAAMAASGVDFSPDTILPLLQLPVDSDGFPEYKEAGGVGGDDGLVKFESLT